MTQNRFARSMLIVVVLIFWILTWSLIRLLVYRQDLTGSYPSVSIQYGSLVIVVGLLTIGWAVVGFLFLSRWHQITASVVDITKRSRAAYWFAWLVPALLWTLSFAIYRLAVPVDVSLIDGPTMVLVFWGFAVFLCLIKYLYIGAEEKQSNLSSVRPQSDRLDSIWRSVPAAPATPVSILVVTATTLLIFRDSLFDPESIIFGMDVFDLYYMFENFVRETLHAGKLPAWNPYIFSGSPALSHPQYLVFYPPQMLLRLLPLNLSLSWAVAFHVWIAGIGMFALCRRLALQSWIALTCALAYMLNSGLLLRVLAGHVWLLYALAWFPLVWMLIMVALDTGLAAAVVGAAVGTSMIILTGHPTFPIYILTFFGFYWMYVCWDLRRKGGSRGLLGRVTARFVFIIVLAIGLSAIQLVPSAVMGGQVSMAGGYDPGQANFSALAVPDLFAILIPRFCTTVDTWFPSCWELIPYMGILFVLVPPFAYAAKPENSLVYFLGAIALFSLALAFGASAGVFQLLYALFPPFRVSRVPPRAFVLWIPAITVLGGMGLQTVSKRSVDVKWFTVGSRVYATSSLFILGSAAGHWLNRHFALADKFSAGGLLSVQLVVIGLTSILVPILFGVRLVYQRHSLTRFLFLSVLAVLACLLGVVVIPSDLSLAGRLIALGLLIGANVLLITFLYNYGPAPLTILLLLTLVCLDLGSFSLQHIFEQHPPVFYQDERVVLQYVGPQEFRRVVSARGKPDRYMLGRMSHIDGYNSGILQGYETFLRAVSGSPGTGTTQILSANSKVDLGALDFLGVEHIIATGRFDDELELIASHGRYYLYRNPNAFARAFLVYDVRVVDSVDSAVEALTDKEFDYAESVVLLDEAEIKPGPVGEASVSVDEYTPSSGNLTMTVYTSAPGVLVMSEPHFSERRAWVDGQEVKLLRANIGFSAVGLSAGTHKVELRYVPTSLYIGATIAALAILICIGVVLGSRAKDTNECQSEKDD